MSIRPMTRLMEEVGETCLCDTWEGLPYNKLDVEYSNIWCERLVAVMWLCTPTEMLRQSPEVSLQNVHSLDPTVRKTNTK